MVQPIGTRDETELVLASKIKWPDVPFRPGQYRFQTCCSSVPKDFIGMHLCPVLLKNWNFFSIFVNVTSVIIIHRPIQNCSYRDLFRSFKVCSVAKERVGAERNGKLPHLCILSKIATLVPAIAVKNLSLGRTLWWYVKIAILNFYVQTSQF